MNLCCAARVQSTRYRRSANRLMYSTTCLPLMRRTSPPTAVCGFCRWISPACPPSFCSIPGASTSTTDRYAWLCYWRPTRIAISDQVYFNFSPVAWAPLATSTGYSHTGYVDKFTHDLAAAQALLAGAGYADSDADGVVDRDGEPLTLTAVVPPWGGLPAGGVVIAESVASPWRPRL